MLDLRYQEPPPTYADPVFDFCLLLKSERYFQRTATKTAKTLVKLIKTAPPRLSRAEQAKVEPLDYYQRFITTPTTLQEHV